MTKTRVATYKGWTIDLIGENFHAIGPNGKRENGGSIATVKRKIDKHEEIEFKPIEAFVIRSKWNETTRASTDLYTVRVRVLEKLPRTGRTRISEVDRYIVEELDLRPGHEKKYDKYDISGRVIYHIDQLAEAKAHCKAKSKLELDYHVEKERLIELVSKMRTLKE